VGVPCGVAGNLVKHIYAGWDLVLEKRAAYSDKANPFLHPANAGSTVTYSQDMLPRTLDILRRSVLVPLNPDWTPAEVDTLVAAIRRAAQDR
jgi:dTDP-4-amino-4,6-dideoxygalactose transaminase